MQFLDTQHAWLLWHILLASCVALLFQQLLGQFVPAVAVCTMQAPCYDMGTIPTSAGLQAVGNTSPARGRPLLTFLLCPCRVCVFTGNPLRAVRACVQ